MNFAASATETSKTAGIIAGLRSNVDSLQTKIAALRYDNERLRQEKAQVQRLFDEEKARAEALATKLQEVAPSTLTAMSVLNEISHAHDIPVHVIKGPRRSPTLVHARHHAIYEVARRCSWMSLPEIGAMFNRDHTTIIHAIREWPSKAAKLGISVLPLGRERSGE